MLETSIKKILNSVTFNSAILSPSEWIEKHRYVQRAVSARLEGMYSFKNTPYMREIIDHLSEYSPVTHIILEKGVRIGASFALEDNGFSYIASERPTSTLIVSDTKDHARERMEGIDFGIDGCNIRHLIGKATMSKNNSKGDTANYKSFSGGFKLHNAGGQSDTEFRSITAGVIYIDEVDSMKFISLSSGSVVELFEDRAITYGETKKIYYLSSPLLEKTSVIHAKYLAGDQNKYLLPCPKCGDFIELVWNKRNENNTRYGVIFNVFNNEVVKKSVRYRCGKCENEFQEKKYKMDMLNAGFWKPTMETLNPYYKSYHISALYAPTTFDNWYDFSKKYQEAFPRKGIKEDGKYQHFINSILGLPYKPEGITIKSTALQKNRREYKIGECPFELSKKDNNGEIMILSLSCDLNGEENDGRIDWEIEGKSEKGATYSIDAGSCGTFIPAIEKRALEKEGINAAKLNSERIKYTYKTGVEHSVWDEFEKIILKTYGRLDRKLTIIVVDVGYMKDYAMSFIKKIRNMGFYIIPVMGADEDIFTGQNKTEDGNIYKINKEGDIYLLNVNIIKDKLAKYIDSESYVDDEGQMQQSQYFMNYPEYDLKVPKYTYRNYFAHYEAEQKIVKKTDGGIDRYLWEKKRTGIQNHFWDVKVYLVFCAIFMADYLCSADHIKRMGYKSSKIKPSWELACTLIKEASRESNIPLS